MNPTEQRDDGLPFLRIIFKYIALSIRKWYIFALFLAIFLSYAYWKVRYSEPMYQTSASIKFTVENQDIALPSLSDAAKKRASFNINSELVTLKSRNLLDTVFSRLPVQISYYREGRVKKVELYVIYENINGMETLYLNRGIN
jgi:hypothetical protein